MLHFVLMVLNKAAALKAGLIINKHLPDSYAVGRLPSRVVAPETDQRPR
jgi:hypothetical protein